MTTENTPEHVRSPEETRLIEAILAGDIEAGDELYRRYDGLVRSIARGALRDMSNGSVDFDDLVQAGWEFGLKQLKNHGRSDDHKHISLRTLFRGFMNQALERQVLNEQHAVHIPAHVNEKLNRLRAINHGRMVLDEEPLLDEEIGDEFDMPVGPPFTSGALTTGNLYQAVNLTQMMQSLEAGISPEDDFLLDDDYDDHTHDHRALPTSVTGGPDEPIDEHIIEMQLREDLFAALDMLNQRHRQVIEMRYGLETGEPMTFVEIAEIIGNVTSQAVGATAMRAIKLMRKSSEIDTLRTYLQE